MPTRLLFSVITLLALSLFTAAAAHAQVVINEVSPASDPEWVELYNTQNTQASLEGCTLYLHPEPNNQKIEFSSSDTFQVEEDFRIIKKGNEPWTSNWLNNDGDELTLVCAGYTDAVAYGDQEGSVVEAPQGNQTFGRSPDGSGTFAILASNSEGGSNSGPLPTPTLTPTPSPKPSTTPTPTPTSTPTVTPRPTPTIVQTKSTPPTLATTPPVLGIQESESQSPSSLEGNEIQIPEEKESQEEGKEQTKTSNRRAAYTAPFLISVAGVVLLGASSFPLIKNRLKHWKTKKQEGI